LSWRDCLIVNPKDILAIKARVTSRSVIDVMLSAAKHLGFPATFERKFFGFA